MDMVEQTSSIVVRAADELRAMILDGRLEPSQPLRQDALAQSLGISRTPLRLALQVLAREGLISVRHNHSAAVVPVTAGDVEDLFDMRVALESLALRAAFGRFDKVRLAVAEQWIDASETATGRGDLAAANWRFHEALYAPCQRPMLLATIADLNVRATRAVIIGLSVQSRPQHSRCEHVALLAACRDRDPVRALALLAEHLHQARDAALAVLSSQEPPRAGP